MRLGTSTRADRYVHQTLSVTHHIPGEWRYPGRGSPPARAHRRGQGGRRHRDTPGLERPGVAIRPGCGHATAPVRGRVAPIQASPFLDYAHRVGPRDRRHRRRPVVRRLTSGTRAASEPLLRCPAWLACPAGRGSSARSSSASRGRRSRSRRSRRRRSTRAPSRSSWRPTSAGASPTSPSPRSGGSARTPRRPAAPRASLREVDVEALQEGLRRGATRSPPRSSGTRSTRPDASRGGSSWWESSARRHSPCSRSGPDGSRCFARRSRDSSRSSSRWGSPRSGSTPRRSRRRATRARSDSCRSSSVRSRARSSGSGTSGTSSTASSRAPPARTPRSSRTRSDAATRSASSTSPTSTSRPSGTGSRRSSRGASTSTS